MASEIRILSDKNTNMIVKLDIIFKTKFKLI